MLSTSSIRASGRGLYIILDPHVLRNSREIEFLPCMNEHPGSRSTRFECSGIEEDINSDADE